MINFNVHNYWHEIFRGGCGRNVGFIGTFAVNKPRGGFMCFSLSAFIITTDGIYLQKRGNKGV